LRKNTFVVIDRRTFLLTSASAFTTTSLSSRTLARWKKQPGLELYTVRDILAKDFEGTIARVAAIGYKEVEVFGYGGLNPKQFRALLDRHGLDAPSSHGAAVEGTDLDRQLEGHRIMGFRYTAIRPAQPATPPGATAEERVKRAADQHNKHGALAKKHGMKVMLHNHASEFDRLEGSTKTEYDVLLAETDPAVVAMQLDIGWASIAGQDVLALFRKHPGRFELWHVKDVTGLRENPPGTPPGKRRGKFVPVGQGEIDYRLFFSHAEQAGLKHYAIEQDNAAENGADSLTAARASYQGLMKILSLK
jgi:sugar phosphate isomerase/epimerase